MWNANFFHPRIKPQATIKVSDPGSTRLPANKRPRQPLPGKEEYSLCRSQEDSDFSEA